MNYQDHPGRQPAAEVTFPRGWVYCLPIRFSNMPLMLGSPMLMAQLLQAWQLRNLEETPMLTIQKTQRVHSQDRAVTDFGKSILLIIPNIRG